MIPPWNLPGLWTSVPTSGSDPVSGSGCLCTLWLSGAASLLPVSPRAQENRYVGFGNTVPPPKREDDFLNSAMSSLYSVRMPSQCPPPRRPRASWRLATLGVQWPTPLSFTDLTP